jgi:hypothetical protein
MSDSTGAFARALGIYRADCRCQTDVKIWPRQLFPPCPVCGTSVEWRALITESSDLREVPGPP